MRTKKFKKKAIVVVVVLFLGAVFLVLYSFWGQQEKSIQEFASESDISKRTGALVDEIIFTQETDLGKVAGMIDGGTYHLFSQGISNTTIYGRLRDSQNATFDMSYGSSSELTFNPVGPEFKNGDLNPFSSPKIRESLNWLINRRYIAEELFGGLAVPRFMPLNTAFPDYSRLAQTVRMLELKYAPNPAKASRIIKEQMKKMGATWQKGHWMYKNRPVTLHLLIRSEDTRKQIGDYIGNLLEDEGFAVSRQYRTAEEGARIWFGSDPAIGQWHIYTGGWVSTVINRDESQNLSFYYTQRGRSAPLWQAYTPSEQLDSIAQKLERRDYTTWQERQNLLAKGLELAMEDSVRIWLVDQFSIFPRSKDIAVAADLAGGISGSRLWPYTLRFKNRLGGTVIFATPSVLTEPWNLVAGSNWLFDSMIYRALDDFAVIPDPYTGLYHPQRIQRAEVAVSENLPVTKSLDWVSIVKKENIVVPGDAWIDWNLKESKFTTVEQKHPEGLTARTRTTIEFEKDFFNRRWHDGSKISIADLVLPFILTFTRGNSDSPLFDSSYTPGFEVFKQHFKGWKIQSENPLILEVYSDQIFPDAESIVAQRVPSLLPWHVMAVGIRAEQTNDLAFSSNKADQLQVGWMNMVAGPSLPILKRHLEAAQSQSYVPFDKTLKPMLFKDEAEKKYAALAKWYEERNHFWVGDGPFYLHSVHPVERTLVLRKNEYFMDPSTKWLRFSNPEIPEAVIQGPMMVTKAESASFTLDITFAGKPYKIDSLEKVQYMLFDGNGQMLEAQEAQYLEKGRWIIELPKETLEKLGTGANSLEVAIISKTVALPTFVSHVFVTAKPETRLLKEL